MSDEDKLSKERHASFNVVVKLSGRWEAAEDVRESGRVPEIETGFKKRRQPAGGAKQGQRRTACETTRWEGETGVKCELRRTVSDGVDRCFYLPGSCEWLQGCTVIKKKTKESSPALGTWGKKQWRKSVQYCKRGLKRNQWKGEQFSSSSTTQIPLKILERNLKPAVFLFYDKGLHTITVISGLEPWFRNSSSWCDEPIHETYSNHSKPFKLNGQRHKTADTVHWSDEATAVARRRTAGKEEEGDQVTEWQGRRSHGSTKHWTWGLSRRTWVFQKTRFFPLKTELFRNSVNVLTCKQKNRGFSYLRLNSDCSLCCLHGTIFWNQNIFASNVAIWTFQSIIHLQFIKR